MQTGENGDVRPLGLLGGGEHCIDGGSTTSPDRYIQDCLTLMDFMQTGENGDVRPLGLLGGGEHFADIDGGVRKASRMG